MPPKYRLACKNLFFTYPKCHAPNAYLLSHLKRLLTKYEITYIVVCEEDHKDELSKHLHAFIALKNKCDFRSARFADLSWGDGTRTTRTYHGDYKAAKKPYESMEYVKKDGNYIEEGTPIDAKNLKQYSKSKSMLVAEQLMEGKPILTIMKDDPGFFMAQMKNILNFKSFCQMVLPTNLQPWAPVVQALSCPARTVDFSQPEKDIAQWLLGNLYTERNHRQKQLYLFGPPGGGKTTLYILLLKFLRIFKMVYETEFLELYGDDYYDLIILDEFKGQKKITFLNSFIDGTPKHYNVKFGSVQKYKNLPVIFLSNTSPTQVYKNSQDISLDAFVDRLQIVEVVDVYRLCDCINNLLPTGPPNGVPNPVSPVLTATPSFALDPVEELARTLPDVE